MRDMMARSLAPAGMMIFSLIWLAQLISIVGSGLTEFGLGVWVFQRWGGAPESALLVFFTPVPHVVGGPSAGALVARWNRRWVMIFSECGAALSSLAVALLAWN